MKKLLAYIFSLFLIGGLFFLYSFSSAKNLSKKIRKVEIEFEEGANDFLTQDMVNKLLIQNQKKCKTKQNLL